MMMKLFILLIFISFIFSGCGKSPLLKEMTTESTASQALESVKMFQTTGSKVDLKWLTEINTTEEGKVVVMLSKNGKLVDDPELTLGAYLWMESMGHGSSPIVIEKLTTGIYQLSELYFTMTKDWQLYLTLSKNNSVIEKIKFDFYLTQ